MGDQVLCQAGFQYKNLSWLPGPLYPSPTYLTQFLPYNLFSLFCRILSSPTLLCFIPHQIISFTLPLSLLPGFSLSFDNFRLSSVLHFTICLRPTAWLSYTPPTLPDSYLTIFPLCSVTASPLQRLSVSLISHRALSRIELLRS